MTTPRITRITVARLHNLGNYEHWRIEIELDIPEGAMAGSTLREVQALLEDLDPKCPVQEWALQSARNRLLQTPPEPTPDEAIEFSNARATISAYEEWLEKQAAAYDALDHLGSVRRTVTGQEDNI